MNKFLLGTVVVVALFSIVAKQYPALILDSIDDIFTIINRRTPPLTQQRYLQGNFEPCEGPLSTTDLKVVSGELPASLTGTYIRNGPNPVFLPPRRTHHMFDGESFPHRVRIENGQPVRYDRSWLDSPRYKKLMEYGRELDTSFGDLSRGGFFFFAKVLVALCRKNLGLAPDLPPEYYSTHSTAIVAHHQKIFAAVEIAYALSFELGGQSGELKADRLNPLLVM